MWSPIPPISNLVDLVDLEGVNKYVIGALDWFFISLYTSRSIKLQRYKNTTKKTAVYSTKHALGRYWKRGTVYIYICI